MSEESFQFLTVLLCFLVLELIFKRFYSLYIYPFDLFCIEPLIVHSACDVTRVVSLDTNNQA
jgi:hypothetical protein